MCLVLLPLWVVVCNALIALWWVKIVGSVGIVAIACAITAARHGSRAILPKSRATSAVQILLVVIVVAFLMCLGRIRWA
jgi:hypothetical protein